MISTTTVVETTCTTLPKRNSKHFLYILDAGQDKKESEAPRKLRLEGGYTFYLYESSRGLARANNNKNRPSHHPLYFKRVRKSPGFRHYNHQLLKRNRSSPPIQNNCICL